MQNHIKLILSILALLILAALPTLAQNESTTQSNIMLGATWSPDGEFVSYLAADGIHVMDKNGNNRRLLAPTTGFGGWTADSTGVFLIENNNPGEATLEWWIYPIDGTHAIQFLPQLRSINSLEYSHDGAQLAISAQENASDPYQIWVANADGSLLRPLAEYQAYDLRWSGDDQQIILGSFLEDNRQTVEVLIDVRGIQEPQISPGQYRLSL